MKTEEKNKLTAWLASLDRNERGKLMKRAAQIRKSAIRKPGRPILDDEEDDSATPVKSHPKSLDDILWRLLQEEPPSQSRELTGLTGLVIEVGRRFCRVQLVDEIVECQLSADMAGQQQSELAVGDTAHVELLEERYVLNGIAPRRTVLSRPDVSQTNKERVIVANVDCVVIVVSVVSPPLHPRIIDRYLIAVQRGGCEAIIVVNKLDLLSPELAVEELAKLDAYRTLAVPVIPCSASSGEGVAELRERLSGRLSALVGHSGVGKSSLINALQPSLELKTGDVSEVYGRGTHTTTHSSLLDLGDIRVIDTPGIRSFGLWKIAAEDLPWYFPDFAELRCKFRDCRHVHEPGCGVKEALKENPALSLRYETYLRLLESL